MMNKRGLYPLLARLLGLFVFFPMHLLACPGAPRRYYVHSLREGFDAALNNALISVFRNFGWIGTSWFSVLTGYSIDVSKKSRSSLQDLALEWTLLNLLHGKPGEIQSCTQMGLHDYDQVWLNIIPYWNDQVESAGQGFSADRILYIRGSNSVYFFCWLIFQLNRFVLGSFSISSMTFRQ